MTPAEACFLRDAVVRIVERETKGTRAVIAAVPGDRLHWKPQEKAMAAETRLFERTLPLAEHLRSLPHHSLHHRGQLSAYLRAMGAFVPGVFGRSADQPRSR
jgi:uncharacterized damage-inducible protein DinB